MLAIGTGEFAKKKKQNHQPAFENNNDPFVDRNSTEMLQQVTITSARRTRKNIQVRTQNIDDTLL